MSVCMADRSLLTAALLCWLIVPACVADAEPLAAAAAELIYFTDDGSEGGTPLFPGFLHHSIWSGLGQASSGSGQAVAEGPVARFHQWTIDHDYTCRPGS